MRTSIFTVWFLVTATDAVGALVAVFYLWRMKTRVGKFLAVCLAGLAWESAWAVASFFLYWPNEAEVAPAFALARSVGRTGKFICVWTLALYLMNFCEAIHRTVDGTRGR